MESAAAISNSGIPPPTIGAAFHPRMPPRKEKTAPLAVAIKNWDPHSLFLLTLGKTATNRPQEPSTIENKGRATNRR